MQPLLSTFVAITLRVVHSYVVARLPLGCPSISMGFIFRTYYYERDLYLQAEFDIKAAPKAVIFFYAILECDVNDSPAILLASDIE